MTVAFASAGTAVTGTGLNPVLTPTGNVGDVNSRHILFITWKSLVTEPVVTPSAWVKLGSRINTAGVGTGADVGSTHVAVYFMDGTLSAPTVTFTGTYGACQAAIIRYSKASTEQYEMHFGSNQINHTGTTPSGTTAETIPIRSAQGGILIPVFVSGTDAGVITAQTLTGMPSFTNDVNSLSATGDDSRLVIWHGTAVGNTDVTRTLSMTLDTSLTHNGAFAVVSLMPNRVTWGSSGGPATGSGVNAAAFPAAASPSGSSYRNFLVVTWKPTTVNVEPDITTSTGEWRRITTSYNAVPVASGADVGSVREVLYYADGVCPTGTLVAFEGNVGSFTAQIFNVFNNDSANYSFSNYNTTGEDGTYGANYSAVGISDLLLLKEDYVLVFTGTNTDAGTVSAQTMTTANRVMSTSAQNISDGSSTGDDIHQAISSFVVVQEAVGATGVPTYAHTNASSAQGATIFLRLRLLPNPSLSITPNTAFYSDPGYDITVVGLTPFDYFEVIRSDETGLPEAHVRGGQYQAVSSNTFNTIDYEFRFGSTGYPFARNLLKWTLNVYSGGDLVYTIFSNDNSGLTDWTDSADAVLGGLLPDSALPKTYISVPDIPELNVPVNIGSFQTWQHQGNILSKSHVLGRRNPVIAQDVVSGKTGSFTILVLFNAFTSGSTGIPFNVEDYTDFLATGNVFMMRNVAPILVGFEDFFFVVESYDVARVNRVTNQQSMIDQNREDQFGSLDEGFWPVIEITVNFTETDAPPNGAVVSQFTWQTLLDNFDTWQAVLDAFPDWLSVLQMTDGNFSS